ncbi:heme ABC exporter ATP-binding protein CcmA [Jiella endophytica]|uniref:heme ABC exporter ATP-binding protein CcmA n=1 Tax=Jiella endophytica TaxID=2558362 RepID=UPI003CCAC89A
MIALEGLVVGRGRAVVAGPFDAALAAGEALVVTGPNGAGKSTLLRTLASLLPPLGGAIRLSGLAIDGEPAERIAEVAHYVGHRHGMKSQIAAGDNLAFWARYLGAGAAGAGRPGGAPLSPAEALAAVGLPGLEAIPFGYLSAGQQRRASLARLLVAWRPVWILDEPTSALDAASQQRFAALVANHLAAGGMAIAATHQPLGLDGATTLHIPPRSGSGDVPGPDGEAAPAIDDAALAEAEGWL